MLGGIFTPIGQLAALLRSRPLRPVAVMSMVFRALMVAGA